MYTLHTENNTTYLHKNGQVAICPYKTPIPMPHPIAQGQIILVNSECCSSCPFFEVKTSPLPEKSIVTLECNNKTIEINEANKSNPLIKL